MATALGLSSKAIQSYEQGWRKAPPRVIKQLLTLVAINREDYTQSKKCWDVRACPPEISEPCLASKLTHGHYCWAVASNICTAAGSDDPTIFGCLRCDVVQQFLETA